MLNTTVGIFGEVIMKHTPPRQGLNEFEISTSVICLRRQPLAGYNISIVGHVEILCARMLRFWKGNAQLFRKKFYRGMYVRDYPANLYEFEFVGDHII